LWPKSSPSADSLKVAGLPAKQTSRTGDVVICFHLSARIQRADIPVPRKSVLRVIDIAVATPSVNWLKSPAQLDALGDAATKVFSSLLQQIPNAARWHLLFAGPAPGAVKVGQQLNPTMSPPTQLYEFNQAGMPRYTASISLGGTNP
jgi:hypothetical protein